MADHKYRMILNWSKPDGAWLVEIPELPGATPAEAIAPSAIANAQLIIDEWLDVAREEGRPIPEPASLAPSA
jgi:predicted RNase H-like HicB family nuclease